MNITKENVQRYYSPLMMNDRETPADAVLRVLEAPRTRRHELRAAGVLASIARGKRERERWLSRRKKLKEGVE